MSGNRKSLKTEAVTNLRGSAGSSPSVGVGIRFGRRRMPCELVSALDVGCVVELDPPANDCVELYAEGAVIARGEAVVVDGKLGVRVKELLADRLETNLVAPPRRKSKKWTS